MKTFKLLSAFLLNAILCLNSAHANVGEVYGFGARTMSLGGSQVAWGFDGYAAYANPAAVSLPAASSTLDQNKRLTLSWGFVAMEHSFTPITHVVVENNYTSDKVPARTGNVDLDYRTDFGQALGISYVFLPEWHRLALGIVTYSPINQLAYLDTGEPFVPEYVYYRSRTQRPIADFALGSESWEGLYFGAGLHFAFSLTANATIFLETNSAKPSTMRFSSAIKPKFSPYLGLLYAPDAKTQPEKSGSYSVGAVLRFPATSDNDLTLKSGARLLGSLPGLDFNFNATSAFYYDPLTVELGTSVKYSEMARIYLQADYQAWSKFASPPLNIQNPTVENCQGAPCSSPGVTISASKNPSFTYKDIFIPRIGHELTFDSWVFRLGYAYRPSFLQDISSGIGNYLDPPKHMLNAGVGFKFQHFLIFEVPTSLDFDLSYHQLVNQQITKTPGNEAGDLTDQKIGSPGYTAGGKIYGGSASFTLAL